MKKTLAIFICIFAAILAYYLIEVLIAYKVTPELKRKFLSASEISLRIDDLTERQLDILIKVQDPNFWNHNGVEFTTPGSGWTTITQSVAKWFYFHPFRPGIRKIKQTLLARFVLNYKLSKKEQLLIFINHVWFDEDIKGFQNAAMYFYQKDIRALSEDEFISLTAMPVNPKKYNIFLNPKDNGIRSGRIKKMINDEYKAKGLFDIYYDQ